MERHTVFVVTEENRCGCFGWDYSIRDDNNQIIMNAEVEEPMCGDAVVKVSSLSDEHLFTLTRTRSCCGSEGVEVRNDAGTFIGSVKTASTSICGNSPAKPHNFIVKNAGDDEVFKITRNNNCCGCTESKYKITSENEGFVGDIVSLNECCSKSGIALRLEKPIDIKSRMLLISSVFLLNHRAA